jgi:hypothetical protein
MPGKGSDAICVQRYGVTAMINREVLSWQLQPVFEPLGAINAIFEVFVPCLSKKWI